MRLLVFVLLAVPLAVTAQGQKEKPKGAKKAVAAKPAPKKLTIPAGAVEVTPGRWRYIDEAGKIWIYTHSPMGLMRVAGSADEPATPPVTTEKLPAIKAFDEGDMVRFEESTPMGMHKWRKKKAEMNDVERKLWERDTQVKPAEEPQAPSSETPKQE